ncbi:MAG: hypothetical protein RI553_10400 [Salibaculum sp.]|uniref:hypothetical protein n=1 Tax=Salibaculum sp. TaxID=2855480 RepID=UPI0028702D7C|nr:hypothetical protein [Salibaculum sp.]MDR9428502.1 hypothetical protein [Salibaculum sp.]
MDRRTFLLCAPLALAACGATPEWAPDEFVAAKAYAHPGPKALTLFTMRNTGTDNGAHTGLMINASQRVIWDPAGTFGHDTIPERNDVHFGITPRIALFYISYHSRVSYYMQIQRVEIPPATAELALRLVQENGATPKSLCTIHTSRMLGKLPGFEDIHTTLFPDTLAEQFARLPGVTTRTYRESDSADKSVAAAQFDAARSTDP